MVRQAGADSLTRLLDAGFLSPLDVDLARRLGRILGETAEDVALAVAMASRRSQEGHVCLDLESIAGQKAELDEGGVVEGFAFPALEPWLGTIARSPLVAGGSRERRPLVLEDTRLYLARYHDHETSLTANVRARLGGAPDVDEARLRDDVQRLFPAPADAAPDWQRVAAVMAGLSRFVVITGGPGTGKTHTVARILALLRAQGRGVRIALVAPTGKAAGRLRDAIRGERERIGDMGIPVEAQTIHRALGYGHGRFRHGPDDPLATDVLVVDEASMVDVAMMDRLLAATPAHARVILLGDEDQLASVEAGSVLGDVCAAARAGAANPMEPGFTPDVARRIRSITGDTVPEWSGGKPPALADSVVHLRRSYRYEAHPGIGNLAEAIRGGNQDDVLRVLEAKPSAAGSPSTPSPAKGEPATDTPVLPSFRRTPESRQGALPISPSKGEATGLGKGRPPEVRLIPQGEGREMPRELVALVRAEAGGWLRADDYDARLDALGRLQVLCAHRRGPWSVATMNREIERILAARDGLRTASPDYPGRPIIVTRNDPATRLSNGDMGILVVDGGVTKALFPPLPPEEEDAGDAHRHRLISLSRLPAHETAFAISVHKSQGSEFDHVVVVLPPEPSPVTTRELLYTAVTRARKRVTIFGSEDVLRAAIGRRTERASGLAPRLR